MKYLKYLFLFILFCFIGLCLRPAPAVTPENAQSYKGIVIDITEGGVKDAVFYLKNNTHHFYINRGLENKFTLVALRAQLLGKEVTFVYAEHWTPLDWNNKSTHVAKLILGDQILYDETGEAESNKISYSK